MSGAISADKDTPMHTEHAPSATSSDQTAHHPPHVYHHFPMHLPFYGHSDGQGGPHAPHHTQHEYNTFQPGFPIYNSKKKANPGPLGLFAFATTTLLLSFININARHLTAPNIIVGMGFAYGGGGQVIAGILEFCVGNTFGLVAFTSYGAFWISFAFMLWPSSGALAAYDSEVNQALGLYLLCWMIFTFIMLLATFRSSWGLVGVFFFLTITFLFLAVGHLMEKLVLTKIGGYFGLVTAFNAYYTGLHSLLTAEAAPFSLPNPSLALKKEE